MIRLLHLADIHILNNERHDEYYEILSQIKNISNIDYTVIVGDLFNSKSIMSPEAIKIASWFLKLISEITKQKVIIVPGNHDKNEKNNNRLDCITPVIEALSLSNLVLSTFSEIIETKDLVFVNYSIFDSNYEFKFTEQQKIKPIVGLYHGPLSGAKTDGGYKFSNIKKINFENLDLLTLGDIHCRSTLHDKKDSKIFCMAAYSGNPIQLNFGELENKGGIIWEIYNKKYIDYKYFDLNNPYLFKTIKLSEYEKLKPSLKTTYKLRIINDIGDINKFSETKKQLFNEGYNIKIVQDDSLIKSHKLDLTNIKAVENLNKIIKEKFENHYNSFGDDLLNLNTKYYNKVNSSEISSGLWKIKEIKWENLFKFGSGNYIDFEKYKNSILLIAGPNYSGKTSTIDIITFAIFGTWTKEPAKYSDYVNRNKNDAYSFIIIEKDNKKYSIERKLVLTNKTFKNSVNFRNITDNNKLLNGDDVNETEKLIEKYFGTLESFLLTTLITQSESFGFIKEKSTKRKEILNQFLSIDFFKSIENIVSQDLAAAKALYDSNQNDIISYKIDNIDIENLRKTHEDFIEKWHNDYYDTSKEKSLIRAYEENLKNYAIMNQIKILEKSEYDFNQDKNKILLQVSDLKVKIQNISEYINSMVDFIFYKQSRDFLLKENESLVNNAIKSVPCDFKFSECQFLQNSLKSKEKVSDNIKKIKNYDEKLKNFDFKEYETKCELEKSLKFDLSLSERDLKRVEEHISNIQNKIRQLNPKVMYEEVLEEDYNTAKEKYEKVNNQFSKDLNADQIIQFQINQYDKSVEKLLELNKQSSKLLYNFNLLKTYSEIIGKNGLPLYLINFYIESISNVVSDIVSTVLDKDVKLEINESKFNIYLKNKDEDRYRIIESASGAENFFIGLAIRLAFYKISNLVKSDLLIMDEPATSLDHDHQRKFGDFFNVINQYFGNVIIVTHLDLLKEYTDRVILIENVDGYAKLK